MKGNWDGNGLLLHPHACRYPLKDVKFALSENWAKIKETMAVSIESHIYHIDMGANPGETSEGIFIIYNWNLGKVTCAAIRRFCRLANDQFLPGTDPFAPWRREITFYEYSPSVYEMLEEL